MTTQVFDRAETVPLWAENRDWAETLFNPSQGIKVTLRDPDGVLAKEADESDIEDTAMTNSATGKYVFYYGSGAVTTLASTITAAVTSITVATGEGDKLPSTNFYIEIDDEIIKCTSRTADVLTVVRGQRGTRAAAHNSGASVWRIRGWWTYSCKAVDGAGANARTTITYGSFCLK